MPDIEGIAASIFELGKTRPEANLGPIALAKRILGADAVRRVPHRALREDAELCPFRGRPVIFVRDSLSPENVRFCVAHELTEHVIGNAAQSIEDTCNRVATALMAPMSLLLPAILTVGRDAAKLGKIFRATETSMWLRLGEALEWPVAVVTRQRVRVRDSQLFLWPELDIVRGWSTGRPPRGLKKATLRDDPSRVALQLAS